MKTFFRGEKAMEAMVHSFGTDRKILDKKAEATTGH
jgi:hypothetical protein